MHMPKCGGTSISEAMYATVPLGGGVTVIDAESTRRAAAILAFDHDDPLLGHEDLENGARVFELREAMMLQAMAWRSQVIHGHVLWSERAERHFLDAYRVVTLFRDPVERTISNFRMAARRGICPEDFDAYLETPVAANHARVYLRYLSGQATIAEADVPDALSLAQGRLAKVSVLGFLDDLAGFQKRYRDVFGVQLRIGKYNQGSGKPPRISTEQASRLEKLCEADAAIYRQARAMAS
jgi:hypothetical protein